MAIVARFFERIQMAQPRTRPKLPGVLAPALACAAARFHRAAANRPRAPGQRLAVHAVGVPGKIVLFPLDDFARLAPAAGQPYDPATAPSKCGAAIAGQFIAKPC